MSTDVLALRISNVGKTLFVTCLAIGGAQFERLIDTCRHLDRIERAAATLIALTIPA